MQSEMRTREENRIKPALLNFDRKISVHSQRAQSARDQVRSRLERQNSYWSGKCSEQNERVAASAMDTLKRSINMREDNVKKFKNHREYMKERSQSIKDRFEEKNTQFLET